MKNYNNIKKIITILENGGLGTYFISLRMGSEILTKQIVKEWEY